MKPVPFLLLVTMSAGPALAQQSTAETVDAGEGLVIGLAITIVIGAVVGWLASLIVKGGGSGFWGDVLVGIGGSVLASFLFPYLGIQIGGGMLASFIHALIGAVILLVIIRAIRRAAG